MDRQKRLAPDTAHIVSDGTAAAQERVRAALAAVGTGLSGVLLDVCCFELGLEAIEANNGWARGTARTVLQIALRQLAIHYGFSQTSDATASSKHRVHPRHWAESDYRPGAGKWQSP